MCPSQLFEGVLGRFELGSVRPLARKIGVSETDTTFLITI